MIYFLYGENSYKALRKIREFKAAFVKKAGDAYLIEEYDGNEVPMTGGSFHSALGQISLFAETRLMIFKNVINGDIFKILNENGWYIKTSRDIFVFWEKDLMKHKEILSFFKKFAEKTQETQPLGPKELDLWLRRKAQILGIKLGKEECEIIIDEASDSAEWALENMLEKIMLGGKIESAGKPSSAGANPFAFIEKMFGSKALWALKEMSLSGIEPQRFIYSFLWKLKQKRMADAYLRGILAESAMRRNPKNAEEILEKFIFSLQA